jgi:hypothetical protein
MTWRILGGGVIGLKLEVIIWVSRNGLAHHSVRRAEGRSAQKLR